MVQHALNETEYKESGSGDGEGSATKRWDRKENGDVKVEGVQLHYSQGVGDMTTIAFSWKADHATVLEEALHIGLKLSSYHNMLSRVKKNSTVGSLKDTWGRKIR